MRRGEAVRGADLIDSAFDAAAERGEDPTPLEETLAARGRYDSLARALERRVARAPTLTARATALGHLVSVWDERLERAGDLGARILDTTESMGRDIDREELTDAVAWTALSLVHTTLGDEGRRLGGRDRLVELLEAAITKAGAGSRRHGLRMTLARMLLQEPARSGAAILVLSAARDDAPESFETAELLAHALEREGRFEDLAAMLRDRLRAPSSAIVAGGFVNTAWRLGHALERARRPIDALGAYESILDLESIDRDRFEPLAGRLDALGSARLAECLERWMAAATEVAPTVARRLLEVRDREGDGDGATRALEVIFAADPRDPPARERLVQTYAASGRGAHLVRILKRASEADRSDRALFERLVEACRANGQIAEGLRLLDAAVAERADPHFFALRAALRESAGDDEDACSDLERAFAADARFGGPLIDLLTRVVARATGALAGGHAVRLVDLLVGAGHAEAGRRELDRWLARSPHHAPALARLAALEAAEGHWDAAAAAQRERIRGLTSAHPDELGAAVSSLIDACERAGRPEDARESVERALEALPSSPDLLRSLERVCEATGDVARLASALDARADHETNAGEKVRLWLRAASAWLDAGTPASALGAVERARRVDPENADALVLYARAQVAQGRPADALDSLEQAVALCQGKRTPLLARVYLEIGRAHLAADDLFEAVGALEYAFGVDRRNDEAAMLLGLVAIDLEDEKTAERALSAITTMPSRKDAASIGPDATTKAIAFYHLATLAYSKGDVGKARRLATKAVGGDPGLGAARALLDRLDVHMSLV